MNTFLAWSIATLLCLALLALLLSAAWISELLYHARRVPLKRTPEALGLEYEKVSLATRDNLAVQGWWIPAETAQEPRRAVVLLHPMFGNRLGLDASSLPLPTRLRAGLDLLPIARAFHQLGCGVLLFDFRNHGESQAGMCAGGLTEDQDVLAAVDFVFQRLAPGKEDPLPRIGLVGFGLGAAAAITAVGRQKGGYKPMRVFSGDNEGAVGYIEFPPAPIKRLSFLVLVEPGRLGSLVRGCLRQVSPLIAGLYFRLVDRLGQFRGAYPLDTRQLGKFAAEVYTPTLWIHSCEDPWLDQASAQALYEAIPGPKSAWWFRGCPGHLTAFQYAGDHLQPILAFAGQYFETELEAARS